MGVAQVSLATLGHAALNDRQSALKVVVAGFKYHLLRKVVRSLHKLDLDLYVAFTPTQTVMEVVPSGVITNYNSRDTMSWRR